MAVGVPQPASAEYVQKLYRLDMLCDEAKRAIDSERDPRKMLALFDRLTKRLFRAGTETITVGEREFVLTKNEMDETEQRALLAPRQPAERAPRKPTAVAPTPTPAAASAVLTRLSALRSPMTAGLSEQQRDQARAVWAWEAHRAGNPDALRQAVRRGARVVISNSLASRDLYDIELSSLPGYRVEVVTDRRSISRDGAKRGIVEELLVSVG